MQKWKKRKSGRLRHIHAYFGIFSNIQIYSSKVRRNQTYPGIIQAYSGIFRTPVYSEAYSETQYIKKPYICRTLVYSKSWHIQKQRHIQKLDILKTQEMFRTRGIFRSLVYSKTCHIQNPGIFRTLAYSEPETYLETKWEFPNYFLFFLVPFLFLCPLGYLYIEKL